MNATPHVFPDVASLREEFDEYGDAVAALKAWVRDGGDHPTGPWLKVKGRLGDRRLDHNRRTELQAEHG